MTQREKVVDDLQEQIAWIRDNDFHKFPGWGHAVLAMRDALALLKEHEQATIEPKRIDLADETKAWLDKMDAVDALKNIADICMDWDGYRTANRLGGLVNEIWAYARYCADRLQKVQEPIEPCTERDGRTTFFLCGSCNKPLCIAKESYKPKYCPECGRKVKWK